jgi:hypothetical protein
MSWRGPTMKNDLLEKVDRHAINIEAGEIHAFACIRDENARLPFLLDYHRKLGIDRFFFIDNGSTDGSLEYLLDQGDCHVFTCSGNFFSSNVEPPVWSNALRNTYCADHWCLSLDADELFVFPHSEFVSIRRLCDFLEQEGKDALPALVVDMYGSAPVRSAVYRRGESFLDACPFFDQELGYEMMVDGACPPVLTFSRFRERAFWTGTHRRQRPPCITQVPLVRWHRGMAYQVAQHMLNTGRLSNLQAAILHFKFFPGFLNGVLKSLDENTGVNEKGLSERNAYVDVLKRNPDLSLYHKHSARYENSTQLADLGWMRTSDEYEKFVRFAALSRTPAHDDATPLRNRHAAKAR